MRTKFMPWPRLGSQPRPRPISLPYPLAEDFSKWQKDPLNMRSKISSVYVYSDLHFVKEDAVTVVSASYDVKTGKATKDDYKKWAALFLKNVPCNLVIWTGSEADAAWFRNLRTSFPSQTEIFILPFAE